MIKYDFFKLDNGLKVYVIPDNSVSVAVINILYDVGSRDETPEKTGFAHLFEHLMFGGSANIPNYDEPLQKVGGENNAFTTTDYTNYYLTVPYMNIETGFWLESDRMLSLSFDPRVLEVQRKVVIEEFRQRYLNRPYGDTWHHVRELSYQEHPYQWPVIGKEISHIENATMDDVKSFFFKHYLPNRATLVVGGKVTTEQVKSLSEKWFGPIPSGEEYKRSAEPEPIQAAPREKEVSGKVPQNLFVKTWHTGKRTDSDYLATDLLSDVLGRGHSSRLYESIVKDQMLCTSMNCSIAGTIDPGLITIQGYLNEGVTFEEVESAIEKEIQRLKSEGIADWEMDKVKNQALATQYFGKMEILEKCMNLAYCDLLGDPELANTEADQYKTVTAEDILVAADKYLIKENSNVLRYKGEG